MRTPKKDQRPLLLAPAPGPSPRPSRQRGRAGIGLAWVRVGKWFVIGHKGSSFRPGSALVCPPLSGTAGGLLASCQTIPGGAPRCPRAAFGRNSGEGQTTAVGATTQALEAERLVVWGWRDPPGRCRSKRCEWPPQSGVEVARAAACGPGCVSERTKKSHHPKRPASSSLCWPLCCVVCPPTHRTTARGVRAAAHTTPTNLSLLCVWSVLAPTPGAERGKAETPS